MDFLSLQHLRDFSNFVQRRMRTAQIDEINLLVMEFPQAFDGFLKLFFTEHIAFLRDHVADRVFQGPRLRGDVYKRQPQ